MAKAKNGRYEAGKLESDIAYIKAGIIELQEKLNDYTVWQLSVETRLATDAETFANLREGQKMAREERNDLEKKVDGVLKESRWTSALAAAIAVVAGALGLSQK